MTAERSLQLVSQCVTALWLIFLLAAADFAAPQVLPGACPEAAAPVCGSDGISYSNECLARIQGKTVNHLGYCKGSFFSFTSGSRSGIVQEAAPKLPRRMVPKERASAQLSMNVVNAHSTDGFVYVGRAKLVSHPHAAPSSAGSNTTDAHPELGSMMRVLPDWVAAVRFTPEGHVYIAKQTDQQEPELSAGGPKGVLESASSVMQAADVHSIVPQVPAESKFNIFGAATAVPVLTGSHLPHTRHLSIMVGSDERKICPMGPVYPFSAIGQIDFEEAGTPYICSGALISRHNVLTAAHCVWDVDSQSFVDMLSFSPGRYRAEGKMVDPFGVYKWAYATLMKNYIASEETQGDIAVIKLADQVPEAAGTLGVRATCNDDNEVTVTTAGYPSDQAEGECMTTECTVNFDCNKESTRHKCDTYMGQSGSAFWDSKYYIRGVHVRGLLDEQVNEFTTLSKKVLARIRKWELRESGGVDKGVDAGVI